MKRILRWLALVIAAFAAFAFFNNTNLFNAPATGRPVLLAHRGLAQTYGTEGLTSTTCTGSRIHPPEHPFLENTLPSMRAAFAAGADMVEFDIHPTTDGQFAVFHDWTVDCRTEGSGVTREKTFAELKALDIGHGYTADGGATFPFRGKGVGLMPTLDEVLGAFPDRRLLINVKSNDPREGELLARRLQALPDAQRARLAVYGGAVPIDIVHERLPDIRTTSGRVLKSCLLRYFALGWSGHVPAECRRRVILLPVNYAPWLWGWPDRFLARMRDAGSEVFVLGLRGGGEEFSRGIDKPEDFARLPKSYTGGIWTNRVDRIAPLARGGS